MPRCFFSERDTAASVAGVGVACEVVGATGAPPGQTLDRCAAVLAASDPGVRFFGGFRFDTTAAGEQPWAAFPACRFVVPRLECSRRGPDSRLACNLLRAPESQPAELRQRLAEALAALRPARVPWSDHTPQIAERRDTPSFPQWQRGVEDTLARCAAGELRKAVLARKTTLLLRAPVDPCALLARLADAPAPVFEFLLQLAPHAAFLGATPELLYRRDGRTLRAEAVAGTCARDPDPELDAALGAELLRSRKELAEHRLVSAGVREDLAALCSTLEPSGAEELLLLPHVQHLVTRFRGELAEGVQDAAIIARLHPTAAVAGVPRRAALDAIAALEPFDRGWYAGLVGWVGRDAAEFAVAIRSALLAGLQLALFAGAGIVPGSDAGREWDENERKVTPFLKALGHNGSSA